ncbi:MAG: efflux RND transporter periplasmic adaptor subunit [Candidatus Eiseniibacteriota bacterium]
MIAHIGSSRCRAAVTPRLALALVLAVTLVAGCSGRPPDPASRTDAATLRSSVPRVTLATAKATSDAAASFATYLEAEREAELVAETDGEIFSLRVREGQHVAEGDTLLIIDDRDERLAVQRDEAENAWAVSQLNRAKALVGEGHVSTTEVDQAQLQLGRAEAALGLSKVALSRCAVRAPIAGLVWMIRVDPLHRVTVGQPLLRVTDPEQLRASAYLPAECRGSVQVGSRVRIEPVRGGRPIEATVSRVDPLTDPASNTFKVVATFRRGSTRSEAGTEARFVLPTRAGTGGCLVPNATIVQAEGDSTWVWRFDSDRVRRCPVELGAVRQDGIQIASGLPGGCSVVVGTDRPLRDGAAVEVVDSR